jgi:CRISPR-associated endonuclease Csn1
MRYVLGLDIGITSVGWAVLNLDKRRIEDLGVRGFACAENPKNMSSLAKPRRDAQSACRRLRRRTGRLRRAKELFLKYGLIDPSSRDSAFLTSRDKPSPWELRAVGLDRLLTGEEFARALFHIVKRRGFKPSRADAGDDDAGKVLAGIKGNRDALREGGYRTAGQMFWDDKKFAERKRNRPDWYGNSIDRETLEEEIKTLFERQRESGSELAWEDFEEELLQVFRWQLPYASGDDIRKRVGRCTFEVGEERSPRHAYHAERCYLLQKLNNLSYSFDGQRHYLTKDQRLVILDAAYSLSEVTYAQVRTKLVRRDLGLPHEARFAGLTYREESSGGGQASESFKCEKATFVRLKGYHALKKQCKSAGVWDQLRDHADLMNEVAIALTFYKNDEDFHQYLSERGMSRAVSEAAIKCEGFRGTSNLSLKAIRRILPHLEDGCVYSEACTKAGYDHANPLAGTARHDKLPPISAEVTTNPVVLRAMSQARKVVNAVIDRYGSPLRIHVELAREVGKSPDERKEIKSRQDDNQRDRQAAEEEIKRVLEIDRAPTGTDVLKLRLYREQNGKCAYSLKEIDLNRLVDAGYVEIDHVLPYSRSFDDRWSNQVLAFSDQNRTKGNQTPHEFFGHDARRWETFEHWVRSTIRDHRKRENLLRREYNERQEAERKERNLNDTRYIARRFTQYLRQSLTFADPNEPNPVFCVNGRVVAHVRWRWGLEKKREQDDLHHALDAAVIAAMTPAIVKRVTAHAQVLETRRPFEDDETREVIAWEGNKRPRLPQPWVSFADEVMARLADDPVASLEALDLGAYDDLGFVRRVLVSRMPRRRMTGAMHDDTIRSLKAGDRAFSVVRRPLSTLSGPDLANLFAPETNQRLYHEIRERMREHSNNARAAFAEPLRKPTNASHPGPVVRSVKVMQPQNAGVPIRGGIADHSRMVRVDVFEHGEHHFLIPVYVADVMRGQLPERVIAPGKPEPEWPIVDGSYRFLFSLYPYDLVRLDYVDERGSVLGYYIKTNRNDANIVLMAPNGEFQRKYGTKTVKAIQKFEMGILGDYHPIRAEVRRGLASGGRGKSRQTEA